MRIFLRLKQGSIISHLFVRYTKLILTSTGTGVKGFDHGPQCPVFDSRPLPCRMVVRILLVSIFITLIQILRLCKFILINNHSSKKYLRLELYKLRTLQGFTCILINPTPLEKNYNHKKYLWPKLLFPGWQRDAPVAAIFRQTLLDDVSVNIILFVLV